MKTLYWRNLMFAAVLSLGFSMTALVPCAWAGDGSAPAGVQAQLGCTAARLVGPYIFTVINTLPPAYAASGVLSFDGAGNFSGTHTQSTGGAIITLADTGTYTVNGDCIGSLTIINITGSAQYNFAIDRTGSKMDLIETDPGTQNTGSARQQ